MGVNLAEMGPLADPLAMGVGRGGVKRAFAGNWD